MSDDIDEFDQEIYLHPIIEKYKLARFQRRLRRKSSRNLHFIGSLTYSPQRKTKNLNDKSRPDQLWIFKKLQEYEEIQIQFEKLKLENSELRLKSSLPCFGIKGNETKKESISSPSGI